jgi:hypothetical protein
MVGAILLVAAACGGSDESATTQDGTSATTSVATTTTSVATTTTSVATTTTVSSTTTTVPAVSSADALAATDAYFAAFNAGDADAVLALLTTDGRFTERFGSGDQASEPADLDIADELAWFTGQGTLFKSPSCTLAEDQPVEGTTLSCDYETHDALTQAVDALPVPTTATFTVTPLGISEIHVTYGPQPVQPDFTHVGGKFLSWLAFNRPEVICLSWYADNGSCADSTSVEETREVGLIVARYAEEWAAYLDEKGCGYLDGC